MKTDFLKEFVEGASGSNKTAFICREGLRTRYVTFDHFLSDVYRMNGFLKEHLRGDNVLVFSYPYSYLFFVGVFSCVFLGKNIVIIDSFGDRKKTAAMLSAAGVTDVLTDDLTCRLGFLLPGTHHMMRLNQFRNHEPFEKLSTEASIITFTSGTTGNPKKITRTMDFLESQIQLIKRNVEILDDDLTYGLLPMYSLMTILMNHTCLVSRRIQDCNRFGVTMLMSPIKKLHRIKTPLKSVKRAFAGGAILYRKDVEEILEKLPSADITYVYGASEGAVIYKTKLKNYRDHPFTFDESSDGIDVEILNPDDNGVGEIQISGETVIGEGHQHNTGDFGRLSDGKLKIVGRKKYSCSSLSFYNYEYDEKLRSRNPRMKEGFSFYHDGNINVVYVGCVEKEDGITYHRFWELPHDLKHKTKLDYGKVLEKIGRKQ